MVWLNRYLEVFFIQINANMVETGELVQWVLAAQP